MKRKVYTANTNLKPQHSLKEQYLRDEKYAEEKIINKYIHKGFDALAIEELAVTIISPTFEAEFQVKTGSEWPKENKAKAIERLNFAKFNIQWNTSMNKKANVNSSLVKSPFGIVFDLCEKGDTQRVIEFFKKNAQYMNEIINTVDTNKKSPLHVVAKCGHINLLNVLLNRGFSVHFRDKFLRTPLHMACQFGRETCADELLKAKSDIYAKDSIGRTCLHYACCSDSVNLVTLILGMEPDMVQCRDTYGRTPLHYSVWNGTSVQGDIIVKLLEANAEVDAVDDEDMTPLHFAADAGKGKIIPLLLKAGANPFIKDGRTHRNSLELASTDRIREIIIMYSSNEFKAQMDDMKMLNGKGDNGISNSNGNSNGMNKKNTKGLSSSNTNTNVNKKYSGSNNNVGNKQQQPQYAVSKNDSERNVNKTSQQKVQDNVVDDNNNNNNVNMNIEQVPLSSEHSKAKSKLEQYLKSIQKFGYESKQDSARPELYSYDWLKTVNNIESFYKYLNNLSGPEAVLTVYNILSPYYYQEDSQRDVDSQDPDYMKFYNSTERMLIAKEQSKEILNLQKKLKELSDRIDKRQTDKDSIEAYKLQYDIKRYQSETETLKDKNKELTNEIHSLRKQLQDEDMKKQEDQTAKLIEKDKAIEQLTKELSTLNKKYDKMKAESTRESNLLSVNKFNNINNHTLASPAFMGVPFTLQEENSIYLFLKLTQREGLFNIFTKHDRDNDSHLTKNEFINILDEIHLPMEHRNAVIKLSGFNVKPKLSVKKLVEAFYNRTNDKNKCLNEALYDVVYKLNDDKKSVDEFCKELNEGKRKDVSVSQFKQVCLQNEIDLNDVGEIVNNWDYGEDCNGNENMMKIDVGKLCERLKKRKYIIDSVGDMRGSVVINGGDNLLMEGVEYKEEGDDGEDEEEEKDEEQYKANVNVEEEEEDIQLNEGGEDVNDNNDNNDDDDDENAFGMQSQKEIEELSQQIQETNNNNNNDDNNYNDDDVNVNDSNINEGSNIMNGSNNNENNISMMNKSIVSQNNNNNNNSRLHNQSLNKSNNDKQFLLLSKNDSNFLNDNSNIQVANKSIISNQSQPISNKSGNNNIKNKHQHLPSSSNNNMKDKRKIARTKLNPKEKINGELKIQIKQIDNIILNNTIKPPYTFTVTLSINGIDKECTSKEITTTDLRSVTFNWATRVLLKNKTLIDLASNCVIALKIKTNRSIISLGDCSFNWTKCLIKDNWDKYVVDDTFQLLNNRKIPFGYIIIQAKFIPFGSDTSNYDDRGKKRNVRVNVSNSIQNESKYDNYNNNMLNEDDVSNNNINNENEEQEVHNDEEEHYEEDFQINEDEDIKVNKTETGMTLIKEIEVELTKVVNKDKYTSYNYYLAVIDSDNNEIFSSKDETSFQDMLMSLPYLFNFSLYTTDKENTFSFELHLKEYEDDSTIASVPIILDARVNHLEKEDKFDLTGDTELNPITFYMKCTVNTIENE